MVVQARVDAVVVVRHKYYVSGWVNVEVVDNVNEVGN